MSLKRTDLDDGRDPNPDRDRTTPPEPRTEEITGRSFANTEFAAAERQQADQRNSGPPSRGNRSDDVQSSDRELPRNAAAAEGEAEQEDRSRRVNEARGALEAERGTEDSRGTK